MALSFFVTGALMCGLQDDEPAAAAQPDDPVDRAIARGVEILLSMQEGEPNAEWPYEGVYRVPGERNEPPVIPIGYRVGGTAIVALSLVQAPGYEDDVARIAAVDRALAFIVESIDHPLMAHHV